MRGLKPFVTAWGNGLNPVASFTDAWIETLPGVFHPYNHLSHLLQMRGLKLSFLLYAPITHMSHLLQMRGLKQKNGSRRPAGRLVASFTDAWIETCGGDLWSPFFVSHLLQMRGLKPSGESQESRGRESHLLQMRGLKQVIPALDEIVTVSRIFYRCVD